jgi:hypothetical protein
MKVKAVYNTDTSGYGDDSYNIEVDGEHFCSVGHIEPEDATLGRDLGFVLSIPDLLAKAHAAGVSGETFELEELDVEDDNDE